MSKQKSKVIRYMTIDPGKINPAFCVMDLNISTKTITLVSLSKDCWAKNYDKQIGYVLTVFAPDYVYVEQQPKYANSQVRKYGFFIQGVCWARDIKYKQCKPYFWGKGVKDYKERKRRSISEFLESLKILKLNFNYEKYINKLDDIADAFNMNLRNVIESKEFAKL
ncbi:RuvC [Salmon gill poxvirus]|uniref:RuvC n=1 Tax=Salmon gill poxvirus TaxID=1680908 RepID=A0A0H4XWM5_9POXV|nr:RuvC [Salmon gill poxvirus]AKR04248.1 RuvC [Salmon gill poxvirus]